MSGTASPSTGPQAFTVSDARTLSVKELASALLGARIASQVIEASRYEYDGSNSKVPQFVEFFTQPVITHPRLNGICRTDVITVEYNWADLEHVHLTSPLRIAHIEARPRYKAFAEPPFEPGTEEYDRAHREACASMSSAIGAFRAPDAGAAQWLAAIERSYRSGATTFVFSCDDYADKTCAKARQSLPTLTLERARNVKEVECPRGRTRDQVSFCYRLEFLFSNDEQSPIGGKFPDTSDYPELNNPEWILTVQAGMRDGMRPIEIRSLKLEHNRPPIRMH